MTRKTRSQLLILITLTVLVGISFFPPVQQNISYHMFADRTTYFNIRNFANVISNLPFLFFGLYGLYLVRKAKLETTISTIYTALFAGILLTGFGSAYYHEAPNNHHLVNDRMPMTIVFISLTVAIIAERINLRLGFHLLLPLLLIGIASVYYWYYTETQHRGDLRFYAFVQFYPMLFIPLVMFLFPSRKPDKGLIPMIWIMTFYIIAKEFEYFDKDFYLLTGSVSGHTLKHLAAATSTFFIVRMFKKRYEIE